MKSHQFVIPYIIELLEEVVEKLLVELVLVELLVELLDESFCMRALIVKYYFIVYHIIPGWRISSSPAFNVTFFCSSQHKPQPSVEDCKSSHFNS